MKTSTLRPTIDHFTVSSLALRGTRTDATLPANIVPQKAVGLSLADIAEVSDRVSVRHGLSVKRFLGWRAD